MPILTASIVGAGALGYGAYILATGSGLSIIAVGASAIFAKRKKTDPQFEAQKERHLSMVQESADSLYNRSVYCFAALGTQVEQSGRDIAESSLNSKEASALLSPTIDNLKESTDRMRQIADKLPDDMKPLMDAMCHNLQELSQCSENLSSKSAILDELISKLYAQLETQSQIFSKLNAEQGGAKTTALIQDLNTLFESSKERESELNNQLTRASAIILQQQAHIECLLQRYEALKRQKDEFAGVAGDDPADNVDNVTRMDIGA